MSNDPRLVPALRAALDIEERMATDDEVLEYTEHTFARARIELGLALSDLGKALKDSLPSWLKA